MRKQKLTQKTTIIFRFGIHNSTPKEESYKYAYSVFILQNIEICKIKMGRFTVNHAKIN